MCRHFCLAAVVLGKRLRNVVMICLFDLLFGLSPYMVSVFFFSFLQLFIGIADVISMNFTRMKVCASHRRG